MIYLDSSALVKRYLKEEGTDALKLILARERMMDDRNACACGCNSPHTPSKAYACYERGIRSYS